MHEGWRNYRIYSNTLAWYMYCHQYQLGWLVRCGAVMYHYYNLQYGFDFGTIKIQNSMVMKTNLRLLRCENKLPTISSGICFLAVIEETETLPAICNVTLNQ